MRAKSSTANNCSPPSTTAIPMESLAASRIFARCPGECIQPSWNPPAYAAMPIFSVMWLKLTPASRTRVVKSASPGNRCRSRYCSAMSSACLRAARARPSSHFKSGNSLAARSRFTESNRSFSVPEILSWAKPACEKRNIKANAKAALLAREFFLICRLPCLSAPREIVILIRDSLVPLEDESCYQRLLEWKAHAYFITSYLPRYTIRSIGGEPHADTRGRLETVVRVHGFGEFAQAHAGGGSLRARLCAEGQGGRRSLGAG